MPIVSSIIVEDHPQRDGRRAVREQHTDHNGQHHYAMYLAEPAANVSAMMTARAATLSDAIDNPPPPPVPEGPPTFTGTGAPSASLGGVGCWYLDEATGDLYVRQP